MRAKSERIATSILVARNLTIYTTQNLGTLKRTQATSLFVRCQQLIDFLISLVLKRVQVHNRPGW